MYTFKELQQIVEQEIEKINFTIQPLGLYEPIKYVLSIGGKRIRPILALMACNLYTDKITKALPSVLGLEIFHNFTLLHDDIMDKALLRRNQPTVHAKWNENVAILSGDAMMIKAYEYVFKCDSDLFIKIFPVFNQTALEVCEGQQYDMNFETSQNVSIEEYLEMIRLKTAVLIAGSLKVGAIIGGASEKDAQLLYNFGLNIGLAFQLQDDLLDVYGNRDVFGKNIGGDILSNKKTYLLISAINLAKADLYEELIDWIKAKKFVPEEKIQAITDIYNELGIKEITEQKSMEYFKKALNLLDQINLPKEKKAELNNFAEKLMGREK